MMIRFARFSATVSLLGAAGCVAEVPQDAEEVEAAAQAFGETSCATATADGVITGSGSYTSPQTYNNPSCSGAVIVDVQNLNVQNPAYPGAGVTQSWADAIPTNQTDCQNAVVEVDLWVCGGGLCVRNRRTANGSWVGGFFGCIAPTVSWTTDDGTLTNGHSYHFAATARTVWPSGPTRKVIVQTGNGVIG